MPGFRQPVSIEEMTITHEPPGYDCPFCRLAAGRGNSVSTQRYIVRRTAAALAFISPRWWPNNHGHVLVVPIAHHENLHQLPAQAGHAVHDLVREVAVAVRHTYGCDGVTTPDPAYVTAYRRAPYAAKLRDYFS